MIELYTFMYTLGAKYNNNVAFWDSFQLAKDLA